MKFEVIIDDWFSSVNQDMSLTPIENKKVLSVINDFENGEWRYTKFQNFIWDNIKETALSYKERLALISEGEDSVLTEAAKKLRLLDEDKEDTGKGSEIAEIILYGIMRKYYKALPIVPKIFYKQNRQDYAKGSDSIHIIIEGEKQFSLWLGEAKFYDNIENARLTVIIQSVKNSLALDKLKKENSIITNISDINYFTEISDELKEYICNVLSQDMSIDLIKPILNIPILLLYECEITKSCTQMSDEYKTKLIDYHKERATEYFKRQIAKCSDIHMYSEIKFHIILFPVASKERIVNKFVTKAHVYRS